MESNQEFEKNIKDSLSNLDREPKAAVWDRIEETLNAKKKRKVLPFKLFSIGILALVLLYLGNQYVSQSSEQKLDKDRKSNQKNNSSNSNEAKQEKTKSGTNNHDTSAAGQTNLNSQEEKNNSLYSKQVIAEEQEESTELNFNSSDTSKRNKKTTGKKNKNNISSKPKIFINSSIEEEKRIENDANNLDLYTYKKENKNAANATETTFKDTTKTAVIAKLETKEVKKEKQKDSIFEETPRWSISVYAAPTIYNTFSNSSIIDRNLSKQDDSSELTWSYGGYYNININKKFGMRLGLLHSNTTIKTKNISVYDSFGNVTQFSEFSNLQLNPGISNQTIANYFQNDQVLDFATELTFNEVAVELGYRLYENKLIVDGYGGFGLIIINQNKVRAISSSSKYLFLGELSAFDKLLFSSNLGVSASYPIAKDIRIFLNPTFNYQFTDLKSYSFMIKSGITFNF
jgi:hypothetical protein